MTIYRLNQGWSPDGAAVHPVDHVADYPSLADAQAEAQQAAGRRLTWTWMAERNAWRAVTGHDQAAEIEPCRKVSGISVDVGVMP
jgi:hypothetical protein